MKSLHWEAAIIDDMIYMDKDKFSSDFLISN